MGLTSLNSALSGLKVAQQQIDAISSNVSNVGTPGYTRKILPQSAVTIAGTTIGVRAENIMRQVDLNLEKQLWTQVSALGSLDVKQTYLTRIEQFHGPSDAELSISAELARLQDAFSALSDSPENGSLQSAAVNQAIDVADKVNALNDLILTSRNDVQDEMQTTVDRINDLLVQIADMNDKIQDNIAISRTTAAFEDQRDVAIKELSGLMEVSFFTRGDGVLVVQTNRGIELATNKAQTLYFDPTSLGATSVYPDSVAGVYVGNPETDPVTALEITSSELGGKMGGLIELRDEIFPKQMAQLDEFAHKLALRFEAQGLRLFTDASGLIPGDTGPTPEVVPPGIPAPAVPVEYIGFSGEIQVNRAIINDHSIIQSGTADTDLPVKEGSNEVIRRVLEYTFGEVAYTEAVGTIDTRVGGAANSIQEWLGVYSENSITTSRDIAALGDLTAAAGSPFATAGADTFSITLDPSGEGSGPTGPLNININALGAPNSATELANAITALDPDITATVNGNGQIEITSRWDIEIADVNMGTAGFQFLGIVPGTYEATDPYFDVQVGNADPVRITIEPGDTETELLDKLILDPLTPGDTGVPGLAYDAATYAATGELILRAGDSYTNPEFGGDITLTSGPFTVDAANAEINTVTPGTLVDGVNIISAIFGSFSASGQDLSPISEVLYGSESENGSGIYTAFRTNLLGPDLSISTEIRGASSLLDFAQKMVNQHTQELILVEAQVEDEQSLHDVLQQQLMNESGVNLDEELGNLIVIQTAYGAAARVITAVDEMFQELLNAVR